MASTVLHLLKLAFFAANALAAALLCLEMGPAARNLTAFAPLVFALCVLRPALWTHALSGLGAVLMFFGFQSYSVHAQALAYLAGLAGLALAVSSGREPLPGERGTPPSPLNLWLAAFVGVMLCGLPLMPLGEAWAALRELGPLGLARMLGYSPAKSSFYALAGLDRLVLYALLARELARLRSCDAPRAVLVGAAASLPASMAFGFSEFFLAKGKAFAMSDRLTSLFLNPGWYAEYLCVAFPFLLLLGRGRAGLLAWPLTAAGVAAMVLTMARGAWIVFGCLAVSLAVLGAARFDLFALDRRRMARGALAGLALAGVVALGLYGTLAATRVSLMNFPLAVMIGERLERFLESPRPMVFKSGVLVGAEAPTAGMGYETYAWHYPHLMAAPESALARGVPATAEVFEATHNLFIQIFAGGGVLGLAAWLLLAWRAFRVALARHGLRADALSLAAALSLTVFHAFGLFQEMVYIPAVWLLFFVVLAACLRMEREVPGWSAPWTGRLAARGAALALCAALALQLGNAGFAGTARSLGLASYPAPGVQDTQGFYGPELIDGRVALWSAGAASFVLTGQGPWTFDAGASRPDLEKPVEVRLSSGGAVLDRALLGGKGPRRATLTIPAEAARSGQRVWLFAARPYFPLMAHGIKDHRALGVWLAGPGLGE
ncbi:hypothetical protein NNJEOMEG_01104 [Fundidesulfovibrio magnetotacticus]|uniref:O-antigen ligase-related domain-containing protein n=1 Tax=Fundidesulfovibrio magnetotacticus TaxID=2730080 RepID=A0A6V8LKQ2_9BACT|nr:O-antigen ligase family protein [Fundidesulfovibrio magnetotacticus]GFK93273.1 hypothetical protein NNJEOMEG_01104 [Fundidesulfovibrio magnetotacticus]